jgi:asparagine synthase (glutamine-hydrolysing)
MCGIAGFLSAEQRSVSPTEVLDLMLQSIFHRGPDEEGRLIDGPLAMGMRRLSIIDLADGTQPMFDESGRYGIVFNGEIYNYRELRQDLLKRGHQLKTHSDTEVIVHLYEECGEKCVDQLRGMFGFAIWDQQLQELFIARDRLGIKPLYYTQAGGDFVFGSEIKAILMHRDVPRMVDPVALSQYLSLKYVPAPRTLFAGIESLEPGHWLKIRGGKIVEKQRYWDLSFTKTSPLLREEDYVEQLLELLRETIGIHLRSDVPFGAFLSGGLDSSTIVALMAEQLSTPVNTFSVGFDGEGIQDELPYAQQVAVAFGCSHHTLKITSNDFLNLAEKVLWHLDQPIADQATIATYMVAKLARQHVKMVLTGEGGDELFAGYARYAGERYSPLTRYIPQFAGQRIRALAERLPGPRRAKIALQALMIRDEFQRFANWFPMFNDEAKAGLFLERQRELGKGVADLFAEHLNRCDASSPVDRMLYVDSKLWLADYLLLRGDKLTMANSLEARVPLLDHKLVEFAGRLPANLKLRGKFRKYLLKQVGRRILPGTIIDRKKQGFPIPIERWLRKEAAPMMNDLLSESSLRRRGFFDSTFVARRIKQHLAGLADHSTELWGLMSFEMWMREFVDSSRDSLIKRVRKSDQLPQVGDGKPLASTSGGAQ